MGKRGGAAHTSFGSRDRTSRKATREAHEAKPKNAHEFVVKEAEQLGWSKGRDGFLNFGGADSYRQTVFEKGDRYVLVTTTFTGRIREAVAGEYAYNSQGQRFNHPKDDVATSAKDKRKRVKRMLEGKSSWGSG